MWLATTWKKKPVHLANDPSPAYNSGVATGQVSNEIGRLREV